MTDYVPDVKKYTATVNEAAVATGTLGKLR